MVSPELEAVVGNAGLACFWDEPAAFNRRLRTFVEAP
jgi:hypothetical protein